MAVARCHVCSQAHKVKHTCHACFEKMSREEAEDGIYPMFRGMMSKEEDMCKDSCSECKNEVWIPDQYYKCDGEVLEEIMSNKDAAIKQTELAIKSKSGGAGVAYSMGHPVIIAAGGVLPKAYKGKSGMPSTSKPELWQPLVTAATISEKGTGDAEEQESTTKLEQAVKEYETRDIQNYDEWTRTYETTWKGHAETSKLSLPSLVSSTSLVEEYWADPDIGYKKWKRLRPTWIASNRHCKC